MASKYINESNYSSISTGSASLKNKAKKQL